jgi:hypothetical protein
MAEAILRPLYPPLILATGILAVIAAIVAVSAIGVWDRRWEVLHEDEGRSPKSFGFSARPSCCS